MALALLLLPTSRPAAAEPGRSAFAGSEVSVRHGAGVWSSIPGAELGYDPIVLQTWTVEPRWRAAEGLVLTGHLAAETELTDSDTSTRKHEPLLDDAWVETSRRLFAGGLGTLRLSLPTSRESWARRRLFTIAPAIVFEHAFPLGRFVYRPFAGARAAWHAALADSAVYEAPSIAGCDGQSCQELDHAGIRSALGTFVERLGLGVELRPELTASAEVWLVEALLYPLAPVTLPNGESLPAGGSRWRLSTLYALGAEWRPRPAWRLAAALETLAALHAPDGTWRTPFFNRLTQLTFTVGRVF